MRCTNPEHTVKHSSYAELHAIECESIESGLYDTFITLREAKAWAVRIATQFGVIFPSVEIGDMGTEFWGETVFANGLIRLNTQRDGNNLDVLAHELAHWIEYKIHHSGDVHGREFQSVYHRIVRYIAGTE